MATETRWTAATPANDPDLQRPHSDERPRERSYGELFVIYAGLALAAAFWGLFSFVAVPGIISAVISPTGTFPAGEAAPTLPWIAVAAALVAGLVILGAALAYGRMVARGPIRARDR